MSTELDKIIAVITNPRNRTCHRDVVEAYMKQAMKRHPLSRTTIELCFYTADREMKRRESFGA